VSGFRKPAIGGAPGEVESNGGLAQAVALGQQPEQRDHVVIESYQRCQVARVPGEVLHPTESTQVVAQSIHQRRFRAGSKDEVRAGECREQGIPRRRLVGDRPAAGHAWSGLPPAVGQATTTQPGAFDGDPQTSRRGTLRDDEELVA
jgi:hypothetical protein